MRSVVLILTSLVLCGVAIWAVLAGPQEGLFGAFASPRPDGIDGEGDTLTMTVIGVVIEDRFVPMEVYKKEGSKRAVWLREHQYTCRRTRALRDEATGALKPVEIGAEGDEEQMTLPSDQGEPLPAVYGKIVCTR